MARDLPPTATERAAPGEPGHVGFGAKIPGMRTSPVEHVMRQKGREEMAKSPDTWKEYNALSRNIIIVNRAEKGPQAGKPFAHSFNSEAWPEGASTYDRSTWLQPGEYMIVPKDVALHICGNLWDQSLPDKMSIIQRYGDWKYDAKEEALVGRMARMVRIGPPPLPDLLACELDGRGKPKGSWKSLYEAYMANEVLGDVTQSEEDLAKEAIETWERVKA